MNLSKIFESNFQKMFTGFLETLPEIVIAVFALIITNFIARLVKRILPRTLQRAKLQVALSQFLTSVISFLIWTTGIIIAVSLSFPTVTFAKMLTALGLGSIAIGFAFKDIFENFMAGVLVLIREPFQIGDFIEVDGTRGFVHFVSIRDTIIYTLDDDKIVVPNGILFKNKLTVFTDKEKRRLKVVCGVAYGEDVATSQKVIMDAVKKLDSISQDDPIEVNAVEFNSSSIDFEIYWYTNSDPEANRKSVAEVVTAVKKALDDAGIEIPFPYRTLVFQNELNVNKVANKA